ncbi:MAG TPA: thioredoxin domain-containing protein [Terriglobales bacterium]|jgi:protein-disulfide isomerase|nr:thioredoxin domain-containing protein [Terriglobales bacterium]
MKTTGLLTFIVCVCLSALAQEVPSVLRPPKGSPVALIVFEDLQCPQCARAAPLLAQASQTYKIPLVQHDFPLPMHNWSMNAAIMARYFDTHSKSVGDAFRLYVFEHQREILPDNLRGFAEKFAAERKIQLPFVLDPDGKLTGLIAADRELGKTINLDHTPTIYVVTDKKTGTPFVEVKDLSQLYATIDAVKKQ